MRDNHWKRAAVALILCGVLSSTSKAFIANKMPVFRTASRTIQLSAVPLPQGGSHRRGRPSRTTMHAAPAEAPPKRRRRQRTESSGAIAPSETSKKPSSKITATTTASPTTKLQHKKAASMDEWMFRHDMLTKQEEYALGTSIQAALKLQSAVNKLIEEKKQKDATRHVLYDDFDFAMINGYNDDELEEDEEEDDEWQDELAQFSVYGMRSSSFNNDDYQDEVEWTKKTPILQTHESSSLLTRALQEEAEDDDDYSVIHASRDRSSSTFASTASDVFRDMDLHLTDRDVRDRLGVSGGLAEVRSILLKGARARDRLIRCNIKLVVGIAKKWSRMLAKGEKSLAAVYNGSWDRPSLNEAIQDGVVGLVKAVERFDPKRGLKFSTYATYWITNEVRTCFQKASTGCLRVPINYYNLRSRFKSLVKQYHEAGGKVPAMQELAKEMGMSVKRLRLMLSVTRPLVSVDAPMRPGVITRAGKAGNDGDDQLVLADTLEDNDPLSPEDRVELSLLRQNLENAMAAELAPHERDVLRLRLGLDDGVTRTCNEVAQQCGGGLSTSEVRSAEKRAFKKLRSPHVLATYKFLAYLDFADVDNDTLNLR